MLIKNAFLFNLLTVYYCYGAVLLWSTSRVEISPLKFFDDEALDELTQDLNHPEVVLYKSQSSLLSQFQEYLNGYNTAYNPNGEINCENATDILGESDLKQYLGGKKPSSNVLSVLVIPNSRSKRQAAPNSSSTTEPTVSIPYKPPKGPVFYKGKFVGQINEELYGLLYSSQPLLLKTDGANLYLGNTADDMVKMDTVKDSYTRLNVKIHIEEDSNLISLRFIYTWSATNYWSLKSVKISDTSNLYNFDLNVTQQVSAPAHFSYHCSGETVFTDKNGTVELYVYSLQTQLDSTNGKFSDAYDCVSFVTVPILSGLFVTGLLGIGLIIALIAISDIKTMDKFDNYKTKQLVVTVAE